MGERGRLQPVVPAHPQRARAAQGAGRRHRQAARGPLAGAREGRGPERARLHGASAPFGFLKEIDADAVFAAIAARKQGLDGPASSAPDVQADLFRPERDALSGPVPVPSDDFALRPVSVPAPLDDLFSDVRQVERLREARALIGFTRLDAPDPESPEIATRVDLSRGTQNWVPASEVRGERIFLRVRVDLMAEWVARMEAHREAYDRFRSNRKPDRKTSDFDPLHGWPGARYIALRTLSHLLIRTIALECGYGSASLAERIHAGDEQNPRTGILIYTAVPDSEGTLGGLVSLAEERAFGRIVRRALADAGHCSADPLCSGRLPHDPGDHLHGAACHNLTESATHRNIEAGVLVSGGEAPRRAAEHIVELQRLGTLRPLGP
ncbi:DrmB family protein [Streptomyces caelestis]